MCRSMPTFRLEMLRVFQLSLLLALAEGSSILQEISVPSKVPWIRMLAYTNESLLLGWQHPSHDHGANISHFRLQLSREGQEFGNKSFVSIAGRNRVRSMYLFTGLNSGEQYKFKVQACNVVGCGNWSDTQNATTAGKVPPKVPWIRMLAYTNESLLLGWQHPSHDHGVNITHFRLQMSRDGQVLENKEVAYRSTRTRSMYLFTGLNSGEQYKFKIQACNVIGCGDWSDSLDAATTGLNNLSTTARSPGTRNIPVKLEDEAVIQSPNFPEDYPHNLNMIWNVTSALGHRISVVFRVFELEDSTDCRSDYLTLHDGVDLSAPVLGTFCRHDQSLLPEPVTSNSNFMILHFSSDSSISWKGFDLKLSTVCGGALLAQASENVLVSHPKYGVDGYGRNSTCDWNIKSRPERNVEISFSDFDLAGPLINIDNETLSEKIEVSGCENSVFGNCVQYSGTEADDTKNFVEIFDGPDESSNRIGKYFGNRIPPTIRSRGEKLLIRFHSDGHGDFRGFRALYKEV